MTSDLPHGTGLWSSGLRYGDHAAAADAAAELEVLGYRALWLPDVGGNLFRTIETLLGATRSITIATGILNIWLHEAAETAEQYHSLVAAHGDRLLLGLGVSHHPLIDMVNEPGTYQKPYSKMVAYLDALDALDAPLAVDRRVLAALGPRMIALAGERAAGTHPYLGTPELTRRTREALGPDAYVAPEQAAVLGGDASAARAIARQHLSTYLILPNYRNSLLRMGWSEADVDGGGSDALVDRLVVWGDEAAIAARVQEHRDAGASHVCVQVLTGNPADLPLDQWRQLAPAIV
jgi:probable F420-dependent oxidoreductase